MRNPQKKLQQNKILRKREEQDFIPFLQERNSVGCILKEKTEVFSDDIIADTFLMKEQNSVNRELSKSLLDKIQDVAVKNRLNPLKLRTWQNIRNS